MSRFPPNAGIAIGPILFVIALLAILAMVTSAGSGSFGGAAMTDRVSADVGTQANLIRAKINECYMQYIATGVDNSAASPYDSTSECLHDMYPCSDQTSGTAVSDLRCPGDSLGSDSKQQNLWMGPRASTLPPPTTGFSAWKYFNGGSTAVEGVSGGERCFWTIPTNPTSSGVIAGLTKAASKFSSQETNYVASSGTQKFVVFITPPINGTLSSNSPCAVP